MAVRLLLPDEASPAPQTASPEDSMSALINLSLAQCACGDCPSAVPELRHAQSIAHLYYAVDSIPVGFTDFLLGYTLWKSGDIQSAGELMRNGTQELSTQLGWGHPMYVRAMKQYGIFLTQAGLTREAEQIRARIAKFEKQPGTFRA